MWSYRLGGVKERVNHEIRTVQTYTGRALGDAGRGSPSAARPMTGFQLSAASPGINRHRRHHLGPERGQEGPGTGLA